MSAQDPTPVVEKPAARALLLAPATLIWLAAMLFSARATITGRVSAEMEVTSTAYALPGAISASLVTGAAVALAALGLLGRRRALGTTLRFLVAIGTGLVIGLLGAVSIITINTEGWLYAVVGGTVAAAATIGGALAGFRAPRVVGAVCWAAVGVFLVGFALNLFQNPVLNAFGSGSTQASQTSAAQWFAFSQSLLSGLAAGLIAFRVLRRAGRRSGSTDLAWPLYALAGAGPGLLLLIAEGLTRTAGARVLDLAGKVSELELTVQKLLSGARFNSALIVLFAGAISAAIAYGLGLKPAPEEEPEAVAASASASASADQVS
jgi:hypothetical protein